MQTRQTGDFSSTLGQHLSLVAFNFSINLYYVQFYADSNSEDLHVCPILLTRISSMYTYMKNVYNDIFLHIY